MGESARVLAEIDAHMLAAFGSRESPHLGFKTEPDRAAAWNSVARELEALGYVETTELQYDMARHFGGEGLEVSLAFSLVGPYAVVWRADAPARVLTPDEAIASCAGLDVVVRACGRARFLSRDLLDARVPGWPGERRSVWSWLFYDDDGSEAPWRW